MEKRMITTDVTEEDLPIEGSLRPQIMSCFMGHPVLAKQRYPESLPMKWGHT